MARCLARLHAALANRDRIARLFLVAMADPDKFDVAARLPGELGIPSVLVASRSDPWLSFDKARFWATVLNSHLIDLGAAGHINIESGYGPWQEGYDLFDNFRHNVEAKRRVHIGPAKEIKYPPGGNRRGYSDWIAKPT